MTAPAISEPIPPIIGSRAEPAAPDWFARAIRKEELAGHKLAVQARVVALAVIAGLLFYVVPAAEPSSSMPRLLFYESCAVLLAGLAIVSYAINRSRFNRPWRSYLFIGLDFVIITVAILGPAVLFDNPFPPQLLLRYGSFIYFFLFVALVALSYSPTLMLWSGLIVVLSWSTGVVWVVTLPDTVTLYSPSAAEASFVDHFLRETFVDTNLLVQQATVMMLVAAILATVVWRSRRLMTRQAETARERANLARYFSPNMVDELAGRDEPLGPVRRQEVAVLFADIVGFTRMAEAMAPEEVMAMLRDFHGRMEAEVFAHNGTLEKFIGDAMLATFGVPRPGPRDAADALSCAREMLASLGRWNAERGARGAPAIRIGIGVHFGTAVLGDIGSERNMAFAVIGDTVNTTSRLQGLTRSLACDVVISDQLVGAVAGQLGDRAQVLLGDFQRSEPQVLRGRAEPVAIWTLGGHEG